MAAAESGSMGLSAESDYWARRGTWPMLPVRATWPMRPVSRENALSERAAARAAFRLDDEFARGVVENGDADVVVGEAVFELLRRFW